MPRIVITPIGAAKILILSIWVLLFVLLLKRDYMVESLEIKEFQALARSNEESFLGVYFNNDRIGYVENRFVRADSGDLLLDQKAYLLLNILKENHAVTLSGKAVLNKDSLLKTFSFRLEAPFYSMEVAGEVHDRLITLTMNNGKQEIHDRIPLQSPPFIATNRRAYLLSRDLEKGVKVRVPYFDPFTLSVQDTVVEYKGKEKTLVNGIVHNLHHFLESHAGIRVNSWLNDQGDVVKEESPAGFVFIAEPEFRAKDIAKSSGEILSAVAVPLQGPSPELSGLQQISYRLTLPEGGEFELDGDRQTLEGDVITLRREEIPEGGEGAGDCDDQERHLAATPYIQVHDPAIDRLAQSLHLEDLDPRQRLTTISQWVFANLEKRPVMGIPDAATTLANRRGDCNEHAALFAALARNAGLPTRIASGVMLHKGAFYYHAWNEVCVAGSWISVDTTLNQIPADLGHIKFVEGETREQARIGALLGKLSIEVLK